MHRPVCITYDSTCDLTPQLLARFQIRTVPLTIRSGEQTFPDDGSYTAADLYAGYRKDGTLLMVLEQIEHTFGSDNDFAKSDLREHLNGAYMDTLTQGNHGEILKRAIDLTAVNGSKQYGIDTCCIAPLTFDEYRKYHDIIPKPEKWEWSVTPWSTPCVDGDETWVMGLYTNGYVYFNGCYNTGGSRPAFLLPSNYVVEPENALASYTTRELVEELFSRADK